MSDFNELFKGLNIVDTGKKCRRCGEPIKTIKDARPTDMCGRCLTVDDENKQRLVVEEQARKYQIIKDKELEEAKDYRENKKERNKKYLGPNVKKGLFG